MANDPGRMPPSLKTPAATTIAIALTIAAAAIAQAQSPLDQPGEKKITFRSEIKRGASEITAINEPYLSDLSQQMSRVIDQNVSRRTDSDGFRLGAAAGKLIMIDRVLGLDGIEKINPQFSIDGARAEASLSAMDVFLRKSEMGITYRDLQQILAVDITQLVSTYAGNEVKDMLLKDATPQPQQSSTETLTITQSISITLASGNTVLQPGTKLAVISRNDKTVRVRYTDGGVYEIPLTATDLK